MSQVQGFKINIKGKTSAKEMIYNFSKFLLELEKLGVQEFSGVNLYCQLYKNSAKALPYTKEGYLSDVVSIKASGKHKTVETIDKQTKKTIYETGINFDDLKEYIENSNKIFEDVLTNDEFNNILLKQKQEKQDAILKKALQEQNAREAYLSSSDRAEDNLTALKELAIAQINISQKEFKDYYSTISEINTKKHFLSYLSEEELPNEFPCYRLGIRNAHGRVSSNQIFDNNLNLLKEVNLY